MRLPPRPTLAWTDDGAPRSLDAQDGYFSAAGGLAESEAVFLSGCGLPEAWRDRRCFVIGELGFGSGLNFLATWRLWRSHRPPGGVLHFISIEGFPLLAAEAARVHAAFPELSGLAARLIDAWPPRIAGPHRIWFEKDGVCLTVLHSGVEDALAGLRAEVDAWFLDGFAPARNPDMWRPEVLARLAALSAAGARAATYSVAGGVRRGLEAAGFAVEKKPGFAGKRERLEARLLTGAAPKAPSLHPLAHADGPVAVIGAGLAGAAVAHALARRGREVTVWEAAQPASGASGNPAGLMMPRLDRGGGAVADFLLAAYAQALRTWTALGPEVFDPCGVIEQAEDGPRAAALADLLRDPPLPEELFAAAAEGGVAHLGAGVVRTVRAVERLLGGVLVHSGTAVSPVACADGAWRLLDGEGRVRGEAAAVVIATGAALAASGPTAWLPIALSRGQIDWTEGGETLAAALTSGAYAAALEQGIVFGATFDPLQPMESVVADDESTERNLLALAALSPRLGAQARGRLAGRRAAIRATTPDRLPIAGAAPDAAAFRDSLAEALRAGRAPAASTPVHRGLYLIGGLGARGLLFAPVLAERVAAEICAEPQALSVGALEVVHPARFLVRAARRGRPLRE